MASTNEVRRGYAEQAKLYNDCFSIVPIPQAVLEDQLMESALGDCAGQTVLDLGGGTGIRAMQVLKAGAKAVDVVDLTPEMLRVGQSIAAATSSYADRIAWHEGDASQPLDHLPLKGHAAYDSVMANWVMDHTATVADLEGIWRNVSLYLKPGGRYVGVRTGNLFARHLASGKYGAVFQDHQAIPGGTRYRLITKTEPPLEIDAASMETSYSGSTEMHEKFGLFDIEIEPPEKTPVVRKDPEFWQEFLQEQHVVVVKARKRLT
ncbi:S-adenosyl-L-methionine-dependent methyltransferase [Xylariomycetidae sp. FL2044]|nr:S-adenosyl-L-methionine-dependent methyltransferase [Xylariomycetidae sp. FL2044]